MDFLLFDKNLIINLLQKSNGVLCNKINSKIQKIKPANFTVEKELATVKIICFLIFHSSFLTLNHILAIFLYILL